MNAPLDPGQLLRKIKIGRRGINRISAQDYEHFDPAAVDIANKLAKLFDLQFIRVRRHRLGINYRLAHISKGRVHCVR